MICAEKLPFRVVYDFLSLHLGSFVVVLQPIEYCQVSLMETNFESLFILNILYAIKS